MEHCITVAALLHALAPPCRLELKRRVLFLRVLAVLVCCTSSLRLLTPLVLLLLRATFRV